MLAQRIYGLALGYEDLNESTSNCGRIRCWEVLAGKRDLGEPLAGKSTLNRLELTPAGSPAADVTTRSAIPPQRSTPCWSIYFWKRIRGTRRIVLDLDATDTPLHGRQEARFFHGYYGHYCYLPLYVFCGDHLLCAASAALEHRRERGKSGRSAAHRTADSRAVAEDPHHPTSGLRLLPRGVAGLVRKQRGGLRIRVCTEPALAEDHRPAMQQAKQEHRRTGKPARVFCEFALSHQEKLVRFGDHPPRSATAFLGAISELTEHPRRFSRAPVLCLACCMARPMIFRKRWFRANPNT